MNNLLHLRNCKKVLLITDLNTGEIACSHCGAVIPETSVDVTAESSHVSGEEYMNNSRTGQKISLKMADMGYPQS